MYGRSITVVINNVPGQVPVGPINVKAMFGENAVLLHSTGQPILLNEWGFTMECLQNGAMYYLVCIMPYRFSYCYILKTFQNI